MSTAAKAMKTSSEVPMQAPSREIWDAKYRLKDRHGQPVDQDVSATFERVARALAAVEGDRADEWLPKFRWALENGAIPAGRILSNAGAEAYKPAVSLINCTALLTLTHTMGLANPWLHCDDIGTPYRRGHLQLAVENHFSANTSSSAQTVNP